MTRSRGLAGRRIDIGMQVVADMAQASPRTPLPVKPYHCIAKSSDNINTFVTSNIREESNR